MEFSRLTASVAVFNMFWFVHSCHLNGVSGKLSLLVLVPVNPKPHTLNPKP